MPFKSNKQRKYLFANNPEVAKKMAKRKNYECGGYVTIVIEPTMKKGKKNVKKKK